MCALEKLLTYIVYQYSLLWCGSVNRTFTAVFIVNHHKGSEHHVSDSLFREVLKLEFVTVEDVVNITNP